MASYTLSPIGGAGWQFFDNNGVPLAGGKIYTYAAGTTTPQTTWTTPAGTTANANPIILDSAGRPPQEIWLDIAYSYKFSIETSTGILIRTYDNIPSLPQPAIVNDAGYITYENGSIVNAGSFIVGRTYMIASVGSTDFTTIGAAVNSTGVIFVATGVGSGTGTAYNSQTVANKLNQYVAAADFGVIADGVTDNSTAITILNAYLAANEPAFLIMPNGVVLSSVALTLTKGIHVLSAGVCEMQATGTDRAIIIDGQDSVSLQAASNMLKGAYSMNINGANNLAVGDILRIYSGTSLNSTLPNNRIWLYKQWFRVKAISGNTVTFEEECQQDFLMADSIVVQRNTAVGITVENVNFCLFDGNNTSDYQFAINGCYQLTMKNCRFLDSVGFVVGSDNVSFEGCRFSGYSGISTARGTGRVSYRDCSYYRRDTIDPSSPNSAFIEETPDKVYFQNCDFYGAPVRVVSSADATPPKKVVFDSCRIRYPGVGMIIRGMYNDVDTSVDIINCYFDCPGAVSFAGVKTIIDVSFCDSIRVAGTSFISGAADAYTIAASAIGAFNGLIYDNMNGSTLGVHSSIPYNTRNFGNTRIQLPAGQIIFPATQVPSTNANTLDDYEEGTFTPTLTTDGTDFTTVLYRNERAGSYVKIGRVVHFQIRMETSLITVGSASGNVVLGGLPFPSQPTSGITGARLGYSACAVADVAGWTTSPLSAGIRSNESIVRLFTRATIPSADTATAVADVATLSTNANNITVSGCYITAS